MDRLIDIAQALDYLSRSAEGGLPMGGGDAGVENGRRHAPIMRKQRRGGF